MPHGKTIQAQAKRHPLHDKPPPQGPLFLQLRSPFRGRPVAPGEERPWAFPGPDPADLPLSAFALALALQKP
ncbi:hypothetical protein DC3_52720 [Deinococcus cellulosilyticus NBRC 106333 = KACC 11606]|uniref:Uncharacterized protein n=1 Tax=Deinococcus cellulosilyticus (strain DSM 18568 / NBRC 106333 / KACC 11606 / 5516J-15) TaxID=1223518 RepID=A0A511NAN6_DEIC1|nr:hypothetical protein DC3_52720 [Deinococcus cellulosilyticus NBRC 106333 = KACC 11606]